MCKRNSSTNTGDKTEILAAREGTVTIAASGHKGFVSR